MAECAACGRRFTCVSAFDKHQIPGDGSFGSVTCLDPAARGLVLNGKEIWGWPQNAAGRARVRNLRAEQDAPRVMGEGNDLAVALVPPVGGCIVPPAIRAGERGLSSVR